MEVELFHKVVPQEDVPEVVDETDDPSFEGERCGICMDIIIDRGVLNCCQHWFCFECIDNWSTITNLCPLCQCEFQLITCVPVYDVVRSSNTVEQSISRDDDWCIEGKNSTLSFPSYYIDENAVTCLDGDGCKLRNGLVAPQEDLGLDMSIACDSCDIWYHAFCVGFDPEGASIDSWICPRCSAAASVKRTDLKLLEIERRSHKENPDPQYLVDTFSGKMSISIADAGETAVVVSLIDGEQVVQKPTEKPPTAVEFFSDHKLDRSIKVSDTLNNSETELKSMAILSNVEVHEAQLSISTDKSLSISHDFFELKPKVEDEQKGRLSICVGFEGHSAKFKDFYAHCGANASESTSSPDLQLSVGSTLTGRDKMAVQLAGDEQQENILADENVPDSDGKMVAWTIVGAKRKHVGCSIHGVDEKQVEVEKAYMKEENASKDSQRTPLDGQAKDLSSDLKKPRCQIGSSSNEHLGNEPEEQVKIVKAYINDGNAAKDIQRTPLVGQAKDLSSDFKKLHCQIGSSSDEHLGNDPEKKNSMTDIMSIVKGTKLKAANVSMWGISSDKVLKCRNNAAGLRLKKIMKRPIEDKESSILVQKLRKEIREAVGNKSSEDVGKCIFDPKLLAAFRGAVKVPASGPVREMPHSIVKAKKSILQRGNARENLMKKIYATSTGKRRQLWVRDFEVEFWKHRSLKITKPEKIDTLKSVLNLLKRGPETASPLQNSEEKSPILSRLYLADASVFPRNDDIKPLSVIKASAITGENEAVTSAERATELFVDCHADGAQRKIQVQPSIRSSFDNNKSIGVSIRTQVASSKVQPGGQHEKSSVVSSTDIAVDSHQKAIDRSDDIWRDKRKWAREFLARRKTSENKSSTNRQLDDTEFKGKYPLLGQLPPDMRPKVAPSRHTKIPATVRQAQLYRLAEYMLRTANLQSIQRSAANDLAVADAINIEKGFADRSKTKVVYMNLCSQEIRLRSPHDVAESDPSSSVNPLGGGEPSISGDSYDPDVEAALRATGLLSDSPPSSPCQKVNGLNDANLLVEARVAGPDNIFEMDFHPELDIYGEFEYNLEDEDYIGASEVGISKSQAEGESEMKLVFSTLDMGKQCDPDNVEDRDEAKTSIAASSLHSNVKDSLDSCSAVNKVESLPSSTLLQEGGEEPTLAECEELYGPHKDPLPKMFPSLSSTEKVDPLIFYSHKEVLMKPPELHSKIGAADYTDAHECGASSKENNVPCQAQTGENTDKEKLLETNADKKADTAQSVIGKVEAYIKEHIRPLCKSGIITVQQYRWAVGKTIDKVMRYHSKEKNANFLIKEGEKVKQLAEQYVEVAKQKED